MALYDDEQDHVEDDEIGMTSMMKRWKKFSIRSDKDETTPPDLKRALFALECAVDSGSKTISNWEEAKAVLSTVIQFPDETLSTNRSSATSSAEVDEYRKRIKEATRAKDIDVCFEEAREQWKQLEYSRISTRFATSDEPALVDDQLVQDAAAKSDQLLSERVAKAYEEREQLAKDEAAQAMEERAAEAAREEEAAQLAACIAPSTNRGRAGNRRHCNVW